MATIPPTGYKPFKPGEITGDRPTGNKPFTPGQITADRPTGYIPFTPGQISGDRPTGNKPFKPGEITLDKPTGYKPFIPGHQPYTPTIITPSRGGGGGASAPIVGPGGQNPNLSNIVSGGSTNNIASKAATLTGVATQKATATSKQLFGSSIVTAKTMRKF